MTQNTGRVDDFLFFLQDIPVWGHRNVTDNNPAALTFHPTDPYPSSDVPPADTVFSDPDGIQQGPVFGFFAGLRQPELALTNPFPWRHIRWLATFNPRAARAGRSPQDLQFNGQGGFNSPPTYIGGTSTNTNLYHTAFRILNVGLSPEHPPRRTVLFHLPRKREDFVSVGELRHANLSEPGIGSVLQREAHQYMILDSLRPTYSIGESLADPGLLTTQIFREEWPMARDRKIPGARMH